MYEILKQFVTPCGLIWLCLILLIWPAWRSKRRELLVGNLVVLFMYTLLGNYWVACQLARSSESEYRNVDPWAEKTLDVVCVLGGGASVSVHGHPYLNQGGDRVMLGARLYFGGMTDQLIATGEGRREQDPNSANICSQIWRELKIPEEHITRVGGRDTVEELEQIQRVCSELGWKRIGIVTSISHLERVMAYAKEIDLQLHPLPSGSPAPQRAWDFRKHLVPKAKSFLLNQYTMYELLGQLVP